MNIRELRDTVSEFYAYPEGRKAVSIALLGAMLWILGFAVNSELSSLTTGGGISMEDIRSISSSAVTYMSMPVEAEKKPQKDSIVVISEAVDKLKLKDKMTQMSSNNTGVVVQFEKLYGEECISVVDNLAANGISVKTAELKVVPAGDKRLLSMTLVIGGGK